MFIGGPFRARNWSRRSCAHSCSETRDATCSIFSRRSDIRNFGQSTHSRMLGLYLERGGTPISHAQAEERMFAKVATPRFRRLSSPSVRLTGQSC